MKKTSRNWNNQEDKMLEQTMCMKQEPKLKWQQIAEIMHQRIPGCQKTGKQCRERWHNHLAPQLNNSSEWTQEQNRMLFIKHNELGNRWAKIATFLKGRTDNCVKNHFYSTLRRGMRKVNNFIHDNRKQASSLKQFKPDALNKILIVADGDPEQKLNAKNNAGELSKTIKELLIKVSLETDEETYDENVISDVIQKITQFNKNCKKRKGKKKTGVTEKQCQISDDSCDEDEGVSNGQSGNIKNSSSSNIIKQEKTPNMSWNQNIQETSKKIQLQNDQEKKKENESKRKEQEDKNISEKKILPNNNIAATNVVFEEGNNKEAFCGIIDFTASVVDEKYENNQKKVVKRNSIDSDLADYLDNNHHNFGGIFANPKEIVDQEGTFDMFKNSAIGLCLTPLNLDEAVSREMFGDSGVGFKKAEAFNNLSAFSDRNSFLKLDGDKGVIEAESLEFKRASGVQNSMTGLMGLSNINSSFRG